MVQELQRTTVISQQEGRRSRRREEDEDEDENCEGPPAKRSKAGGNEGYQAGKKFVALYCMWATKKDIFGKRSSKEQMDGSELQQEQGSEERRRGHTNFNQERGYDDENVFEDEPSTSPARRQGLQRLERDSSPGEHSEGRLTQEQATQGQEMEDEQPTEEEEVVDPFFILIPNTKNLDIRAHDGRKAFIEAKVEQFRMESLVSEVEDWDLKSYQEDFMRGMSKMRSSIKSTIVDLGNEMFDLQLSPKELTQWKDDSSRRYLAKVKTLIENPDFCCNPEGDEGQDRYKHGYRHDGLLKVHL